MYWKNANHSIILRLTLLYTFSIMLILLIVSSALYLTLKHDLKKNEQHFLYVNPKVEKSLQHYLRHERQETLEDYWQTLLITSFFGIISSALLGFLLASRSMKPVKNITQAMKKINVSKLELRLDTEENWPEEFINLANHFNAMLHRLENSFKHLLQFSADLAHELRTPINNLKGEAEICLMKSRSALEYQQVITSSLEEYERLSQIIKSLLFLARAEVPETQLTYQTIPVRKTILTIVDFYMPLAEEKSITFNCMGDEENQLFLSVNEALFQRVIHNLCSNALRYTLAGGSITINIHSSQKNIILDITDTGIGIAPEHLPHLFERFYRTDSARNKESGGSGLGLAIVKSIMELHHAEISIRSTFGKGTTVSLVFPLF